MPAGRLHIDPPLPAAAALARGAYVASAVSAERPVAFYGAPLSGTAVVLGAYQHALHALDTQMIAQRAVSVVRRQTGGSAVSGGNGVLYAALGLLDASALMRCPPGRILNRNVRGALAGLRSLGVPTHYFGRDFLSFGKDPGVYIAWDEAGDGRVLLEFFVGCSESFVLPPELIGYPEADEAPLRGKTPVTLRSVSPKVVTEHEVLAAIAGGYAKAFDVTFENASDSTDLEAQHALADVDPNDDRGLWWSDPQPEAIGFVSAGVRLDAAGRIEVGAVLGDFFQQRDCPAQLGARLRGCSPDAEAVGAALDAVYTARPGLIEGVRTLRTLEAALLQAAARAR